MCKFIIIIIIEKNLMTTSNISYRQSMQPDNIVH